MIENISSIKSESELVIKWIPLEKNLLADALSHFNNVRIANLAPQLKYLHRSFINR